MKENTSEQRPAVFEESAHQHVTKEEYEKLPPEIKLQAWRESISRMSLGEYSRWSEDDKETLLREYNSLIDACRKAGDLSQKEIDESELRDMLIQ